MARNNSRPTKEELDLVARIANGLDIDETITVECPCPRWASAPPHYAKITSDLDRGFTFKCTDGHTRKQFLTKLIRDKQQGVTVRPGARAIT
jgi:hypothetical protein